MRKKVFMGYMVGFLKPIFFQDSENLISLIALFNSNMKIILLISVL